MGLNYDITQVQDWETKSKENPWLNGLIWATLAIDMGTITDKNVKEFYARLKSLTFDGDNHAIENFPTFDEVKDWIGLKTNVSTLTVDEWKDKIKRIMTDRYMSIVRKLDKLLET